MKLSIMQIAIVVFWAAVFCVLCRLIGIYLHWSEIALGVGDAFRLIVYQSADARATGSSFVRLMSFAITGGILSIVAGAAAFSAVVFSFRLWNTSAPTKEPNDESST